MALIIGTMKFVSIKEPLMPDGVYNNVCLRRETKNVCVILHLCGKCDKM